VTDRVRIGIVGRPHGLDGSFVIERPSDRIAKGLRMWAGDRQVEIVSLKRVGGGRLAIKLDCPVERGTELELERAELPEPEEGAYYVFELIGLEVVEQGGRPLGTIVEVAPYPANDVIELDSGALLPMIDECVLEVDLEARRIVVAPGYAPE
jgi:16S rRNA processing protein RimM